MNRSNQQSKHISQHSPGATAMLAHADVKRETMKKLAVVLALGVALVGCSGPRTKEINGLYTNVDVVKFDGHEYLCISGYTSGVVHSESCPCKSK